MFPKTNKLYVINDTVLFLLALLKWGSPQNENSIIHSLLSQTKPVWTQNIF